MNLREITDTYQAYDMTQGVEHLLKLKQGLAILIMQIANKIAELEEESKQLSTDKKIQFAQAELAGTGTIADRKNRAINALQDLVIQEAQSEGELKAYRIKYEGMVQLSHSMSSFLQKM